jgi:hypothetical protein
MIYRRSVSFFLRAGAIAGAIAVLSAASSRAQDFVVSTFDKDPSDPTSSPDTSLWMSWWGAANQTYEFDPNVDANDNANSGSLKATIDFDLASAGGDNQFAVIGAFPNNATLDGAKYTNLVFDIKWAGNSPLRSFGDFGNLDFGFRASDFSQIWLAPTSPLDIAGDQGDKWIHVVAPIDPSLPKIDQITGVVLKMWSGDPGWGQTGTATFWLDNVKLIENTNAEVPHPTLSIEKTDPGLTLFASSPGSQYQRQNIRTIDPSYSWVDAGNPVTYSITIEDYPDTNHTGFQTQMFLVPTSSTIPTFESSPDWNEPNVIFLDIENTVDGAYAAFRYKTDEPNGNTMIYGAGTLATIGSSTIKGTWSLTFANNTDVTITTPDGSKTNFTFDASAAFANPLYAYFGIQPNKPENINQAAVFSRIQITGVPTPIDETFAGVQQNPDSPLDLDPAIWERAAESAPGVVLVPPDALYEIDWTTPAAGFKLQMTSDLKAWTDVPSPSAQIGNSVKSWVTATELAGATHAFFRVVKPDQPPAGE